MPSDLFIITGTPRSGTTRLAAFCKMMGQPIEGLWLPEHHDGGLEDSLVRLINKHIIEHGVDQDACDAIKSFPRPIIKEPRFVTLRNPSLFEAWVSNRPNSRVLLMERDFLQVGRSLHNSRGIKAFGATPEEAASHLQEGFDQLVKTIERLGIPHRRLHHPDFIDSFDEFIDILMNFAGMSLVPDEKVMEEYGVVPGSPKEVWEQWFDSNAVRQHGPEPGA
jgi:hypothetical protein